MKAITLRNLVILTIILGTFTTTNASLLTTITTEVSGGIAGAETNIKPMIAFNSDAVIFNHLVISQDQIGNEFTITSDTDDPNFSLFIEQLTNQKDEILKVGHEIGFVKGNLGNLESSWFGTELIGKNITRITLKYDIIEFESAGNGDNWTNFTYKVTLAFYDDAPSINMDLVDNAYNRNEVISNNNTTKGDEEEEMTMGATMAFDTFENVTDKVETQNVTSDKYIMNISKVTPAKNSEKKTSIRSEKKTHKEAIANYLINNIRSKFVTEE